MSAPDSAHSAPGGALHKTGCARRKDGGRTVTLPCGCASDDFTVFALCQKQAAPFLSLRLAAAMAHKPAAHKAAPDDPLLA